MDRIRSLHPSQRKHYRIQAPIRVEIDGQVLDTLDWSSGGFRVGGFTGTVPDSAFEVSLSIPFQGFWVSGTATAEVRRYDDSDGALAAEFVDLPERTRELLDYFASGLLSGEMSTIEGAIRRLDTPVTPTDTQVKKDDRELKVSYHIKRWATYATYTLVGAILTWYVGSSMFNRVWRLQVMTAAVAAPTEALLSPGDGRLDETYVHEGQWVNQGDPLFRIVVKNAAAHAQASARSVEESQMALQLTTALHEVELKKLGTYRQVLEARMAASQSRLNLLEQQGELLRKQFERESALHESGVVSRREMELSETAHMDVLVEVEEVKREVALDAANLEALKSGFLIDGVRLQANLPGIEAELKLARAQVALERRTAAMQKAGDTVLVVAPFDGRVADLTRSEGTSVREGAEVLLLERSGVRRIEAWLTPEQAAYVELRDEVQVEVMAMDYIFRGTVVALGSKQLTSERSSLLGRDPRLKAVIELVGLSESDSETRTSFKEAMGDLLVSDSVGLLAKVTFRRAW